MATCTPQAPWWCVMQWSLSYAKGGFCNSQSEKNYEHQESHLLHPHYLKDGKLLCWAKSFGSENGFKQFLKTGFSDFAHFHRWGIPLKLVEPEWLFANRPTVFLLIGGGGMLPSAPSSETHTCCPLVFTFKTAVLFEGYTDGGQETKVTAWGWRAQLGQHIAVCDGQRSVRVRVREKNWKAKQAIVDINLTMLQGQKATITSQNCNPFFWKMVCLILWLEYIIFVFLFLYLWTLKTNDQTF